MFNQLKKVIEKGASCIELQAINGKIHEEFYGRIGYQVAQNFIINVKLFEDGRNI